MRARCSGEAVRTECGMLFHSSGFITPVAMKWLITLVVLPVLGNRLRTELIFTSRVGWGSGCGIAAHAVCFCSGIKFFATQISGRK